MLGYQLARVASGGLAALLLAKGLDFSTDQESHKVMTYVGFYGAGALFVVAAAWLTLVIHGHKEAADAAEPQTRPLTWGDLKTMRVPAESDVSAEATKEAKRRARRIYTELEASRKRVDAAIANGHWWNVLMEGLQSDEWEAGRDLLADEAPKVHDAVATVYVLIDAANTEANNHYQGGNDYFEEDVAKELRRLRGRTRTAMKTLRGYFEP